MRHATWIGAAGFGLWGLLHIAGGGMILAATLGDPAQGFASYAGAGDSYDALAGAILAYFAYGIAALGLVALIVAATGNRRNSSTALMANTVLVVLTEIGLILFLLVPGFVPILQALPGLVLAAAGVIAGGIACRGDMEARHEPA